MATRIWTGGSTPVAQVDTLQPGGSFAAGNIFSFKIGKKTVSYTAVMGDGAPQVAAGLAAAINASLHPEVQEVTGDTITGPDRCRVTAGTAGVPFTISNPTATGGGTLTRVAVTANEGPSVYNDPNNWDNGAGAAGIPGVGDDVIFQNNDVSVLYELDSLSGTNLNSITQDMSYTGEIGLPQQNVGGYEEYRPRFLKVNLGATDQIRLGRGVGAGSSRIQLDFLGTETPLVTVDDSGTSADPDLSAIQLINLGGAFDLTALGGQIDIDRLGSANSNARNLVIDNAAVVRIFNGSQFDSLIMSGTSTLHLEGQITVTANVFGGTIRAIDRPLSTPFSTLNIKGPAEVFYRSRAALSTLLLDHPGAVFDCEENPGATIASVTLNAGELRNVRTITFTSFVKGADAIDISAA